MERYEHVFRLQGNLYAKNSPILIIAGALVKDNHTNGILAQLKFQNLCRKKIIAVKVLLDSYDISGKKIAEALEYQYLDLSASQYELFGEKIGIPLPDAISRSFTVKCTSVYFEDNSVWNAESNSHWATIPQQEKLKDVLDSELKAELIREYQKGFSVLVEFKPMLYEDLWLCTCGKIHKKTEDSCLYCNFSQLESSDEAYQNTIEKIKDKISLQKNRRGIVAPNKFLQQSRLQSFQHPIKFYYSESKNCWGCICGEINFDENNECNRCKRSREEIKQTFSEEVFNKSVKEYEKNEAERIEAEKEKIKNAAKKKLKIIIPCISGGAVLVAVVLLVIFLFVPLGLEKANEEKFNLAVSYMEEARYDEAIELFEELSGYKNSERKIQLCYYSLGLQAMESEDYEAAVKYFEASGSDFKEKLTEARYLFALEKLEKKDYVGAKQIFEDIVKYKDAAEYLIECDYGIAIQKMDEEEYLSAIEIFRKNIEYKDSRKLEANCVEGIITHRYPDFKVEKLYRSFTDGVHLKYIAFMYTDSKKTKGEYILATITPGAMEEVKLDTYNKFIIDANELDISTHYENGDHYFYNGYLIPAEYFSLRDVNGKNVVIPNKNKFSVSVEGGGYPSGELLFGEYTFKDDGTYSFSVDYILDENTDEITGTYTRKDNIITLKSDDGTDVQKVLVHKNRMYDNVYVEVN